MNFLDEVLYKISAVRRIQNEILDNTFVGSVVLSRGINSCFLVPGFWTVCPYFFGCVNSTAIL